jgi:hypothetical protein
MIKREVKILFFLTLFIFVLVVWKWYWKIQLMYNSSIVSIYTPDSFTIPENLKEKYYSSVSSGFNSSKLKKVVFAALVRDVEERLPQIEKKVEKMGKIFKDYRVLIVENDSKDGTRKYLLNWAKRNPKITILGCGYNENKCSIKKASEKTEGHGVDRIRIKKMVDLRNIYLTEIKENSELRDYDYAIFWDLDAIGAVYLDGVAHTINYLDQKPSVDVVCAYGIYRWGLLTLFYDTYALLHKGEKFHIDMKTAHDIRKGLWETKYDRGEDPVEVDSCFSGFSIYRIDSLLPDNVIYDMSPENNLECEHVRLNMKIKGKKVINPSMIHLLLENS